MMESDSSGHALNSQNVTVVVTNTTLIAPVIIASSSVGRAVANTATAKYCRAETIEERRKLFGTVNL